jgi:hypothetical protein
MTTPGERLIVRLHVDLRRQASALCQGSVELVRR